MGQDIYGGEAQEHEHRHHDPEEPPAAGLPCQEHQDGGDADVTAGEGCRGSFACGMGVLHHVVEEAIAPSWQCHHFLVVGEIMVQVGEDALCNLIHAYCRIIELRTGNREKDEDDVEAEEGRQDDEGGPFELLISAEEIEKGHEGYQWEIGGVAEVHQFAEYRVAECLREEQGGLETEQPLVVAGKEVVETGEYPVEFIGVGIPPRQQAHLSHHTTEDGKTAGIQSVDKPERQRHHHDAETSPEHIFGVV